jgi:hypothetical protein
MIIAAVIHTTYAAGAVVFKDEHRGRVKPLIDHMPAVAPIGSRIRTDRILVHIPTLSP